MKRLKRVPKTVKEVEQKRQASKTIVKRPRKLAVGTHEVKIISAELVSGKKHLVKLELESIEDGIKGTFVIPVDSLLMDNLLEVIYGEFDEEEICLEELIGNKIVVVIVRNGKFLNVDYFETLDYEEEELEDGELDLELELEPEDEFFGQEDEIELGDFI